VYWPAVSTVCSPGFSPLVRLCNWAKFTGQAEAWTTNTELRWIQPYFPQSTFQLKLERARPIKAVCLVFRSKFIFLALLSSVALLATSCAFSSRKMSSTVRPDPDRAILFGRFTINHKYNVFHNRLALWLQNTETEHNEYLYFDEAEPVYAVQVKAGHYRIMGFAALARTHRVEGRVLFGSNGRPSTTTFPFEAAARSNIYLGDYVGHATFDGVLFEWKVDSTTNNLASTAAEFRAKYPNLGSLPVTSFKASQSPFVTGAISVYGR
jgi:hypothetical protein